MSSDNDERTRSFVQLLSGCERKLYGYILSLEPRLNDADDIAQDTKIKLWEQFDEYDESREFGAWACTIAYYAVLSHRERQGRDRLQFTSDIVDAISEQVAEDSQHLVERQNALSYCLGKLAADSRRLLRMVYNQGQPIKQVAAKTGRKAAATYQTVWRLRKTLHDCIVKRISDEDSE